MNVICISGKPGSGSTTTSKILSSLLNFRYFSPGRLFKDISTGEVSKNPFYEEFSEICRKEEIILPESDEKNDSLALVSFWNSELGKSSKMHNAIDELQRVLSKKGNIVFDGKLSIKFIDSDLKVWLTASDEKRAERTAERDSLNLEESKLVLLKREKAEREEWKKIYGFDYFEQEKLADLVIDSSDKTPEECAEIIIKSLKIK